MNFKHPGQNICYHLTMTQRIVAKTYEHNFTFNHVPTNVCSFINIILYIFVIPVTHMTTWMCPGTLWYPADHTWGTSAVKSVCIFFLLSFECEERPKKSAAVYSLTSGTKSNNYCDEEQEMYKTLWPSNWTYLTSLLSKIINRPARFDTWG